MWFDGSLSVVECNNKHGWGGRDAPWAASSASPALSSSLHTHTRSPSCSHTTTQNYTRFHKKAPPLHMCADFVPREITHLRLLVDSLIRSRMCWWDDPSTLTPLMVTMISPTVNGDVWKGPHQLWGDNTTLHCVYVSVWACVGLSATFTYEVRDVRCQWGRP